MANIRPFRAYRPAPGMVERIAALPYDVYSREEACEVVKANPYSFLAIDRAETQFDPEVDMYAPQVYQKAHDMLKEQIAEGRFIKEETPCYYLYEQTMDGRSQTGIVACASIDDYTDNIIKKHENTRADKEQDRINHVDICDMQTGPIFLAYRATEELRELIAEVKKGEPVYDFISEDGVGHRVWVVSQAEKLRVIQQSFAKIPAIYIADGHHRCASAVKVGQKRRAENPDYSGQEEFNYFLSVLFADEELHIMDYNRLVKDLNGMTKEAFLNAISADFWVEVKGKEAYRPEEKGCFGMYLEGVWYALKAKPHTVSEDAVEGLDVSILQKFFLAPVLGIRDPKTDKRIDFVGGIRGLAELERRANSDMKVAFSMYPTSMNELFAVADASRLMPPKSTWFEPKLRSGLFLHALSESDMQIFDCHTHLHSREVDAENIIQRLNDAHITGANIFSVPPLQYPHLPGCADYEERVNHLIKITNHYPEKLFPILWIHPDEEDIISKIDDAISKGVLGFKMICNNYFVYEDKCIKILKHIAKAKKPVIFHSGILWDGGVSSAYNKPINWECCLEISGLKFALAHCSWPWHDECLALYGKFLNAYSRRPSLTAEMFLDITPGTPEIYREDLITKLLTIGYDIKHNLLFGTDCIAEEYNSDWAVKWQKIDNELYDKLSVDAETRSYIYSKNMKRFLGI